MVLRPDRGVTYRDQNAARMPRSPFRPLFEATAAMNPSFRFDDVDVVADRTSMRRLLNVSARRKQDSFRLHLHLVGRTLVVERSDESARGFLRVLPGNTNWGKRFEDSFTRYDKQWEGSGSHHRALRYQFGDLSCVVRIEVDASFIGSAGHLATNPVPTKDPSAIKILQQKGFMAWAAEIKTVTSSTSSKGRYLPQLWLGRTPWLIEARHRNGDFRSVTITHMETRFQAWETQHQDSLRTMAAVLAQLRTAVEENGGEHCVAVYEKGKKPRAIEVFPSSVPRSTVSDELRRKLWRAEEAEAPTRKGSPVQSGDPVEAME